MYVFSNEDRDKLLEIGFRILRSNEKNQIYIFENVDAVKFDKNSVKFVYSNNLVF